MNSISNISYFFSILLSASIISGPIEDNSQSADGIHINEEKTKTTITEQEKALASRQKQELSDAKNQAKVEGRIIKRSMGYKQLKLQQSSEVIAFHEIKFQHSLVCDALKAAKAVEINFDSIKRYQSKYKPDILENNLKQAINRINKAYNKAHQAITQATDLHAKANCPEAATLLDSAQKDFSQICTLKNSIEGFYEKVCLEASFKQVQSQDSSLLSGTQSKSPGQTDSRADDPDIDAEQSPTSKNATEI